MYLISAYFDEESARTIRRYIEKITERTGNRFMIDNNVPPHMTISSIEARSVDDLLPAFASLEGTSHEGASLEGKSLDGASLAGRLKGGQIKIVSTGQLLPYVFYLTPVLNEYLMEMSECIYNAFKDVPDTSISRFYRPGSWLPHITIAKTLSKEQMAAAFEVMQNNFTIFDAKIVRLGLSRVNPHEDVKVMEL